MHGRSALQSAPVPSKEQKRLALCRPYYAGHGRGCGLHACWLMRYTRVLAAPQSACRIVALSRRCYLTGRKKRSGLLFHGGFCVRSSGLVAGLRFPLKPGCFFPPAPALLLLLPLLVCVWSRRRRFNTLFYILQRQRPDLSLRVCHRLDRLTSGLTILAKTAERAVVIQTQIGERGRSTLNFLSAFK